MFFSILKAVGRVARLQAQSDGTGSTIFPHLSLNECIERLVILFFHIHVWRQYRFCAVRGYMKENAWLGNALLMVFECQLEDSSLSLLFFWFRFFWAGHWKETHTFFFPWICQIKLLDKITELLRCNVLQEDGLYASVLHKWFTALTDFMWWIGMVQDKGCFICIWAQAAFRHTCTHTHTHTLQVMRRALEEKRALCVQHSGKDSLSRWRWSLMNVCDFIFVFTRTTLHIQSQTFNLILKNLGLATKFYLKSRTGRFIKWLYGEFRNLY